MITTQWRVNPELGAPRSGVWLGAGGEGDGVWLGSLAEIGTGARPKIWLATGKEQVVAVVGKRGSGKTFTLGVIAEGLASNDNPALAKKQQERSVLLFDPLDVYWTTRYAVSPAENAEAERHYEMAKTAGVAGATFNVEAWVPGASNRLATDPDWFETLELPTPQLGLEEWELLLGVNVMAEPIGQAFADVLALVRDTGYVKNGEFVDPLHAFDLSDLAEATGAAEIEPVYHRETLRALRQRLLALAATGLFSSAGTRIQDLLSAGGLSIIMLGRLPQSYRTAVVAVLTRMLIDQRSEAAFAEKRLALDPELTQDAREMLQKSIDDGVPRTVVMLDEALLAGIPITSQPSQRLSPADLALLCLHLADHLGYTHIR